jgi:hypothetical protein
MAGERNIFDELKQALMAKNSAINTEEVEQKNLNKDELKIRELNNAFSLIIKEREALFENYDNLMLKKIEILQSALTFLIASFYSSKIDLHTKNILASIDVINTFNTNEFRERVTRYIQLSNLKINDQPVDNELLNSLKQYFFTKLNELLLALDKHILLSTATYALNIIPLLPTLSEQEAAVVDLIGLLALTDTDNTYNDISYKASIIFGANSNFADSFIEVITSNLKNIDNHVRSFIFLEDYRRENDPVYSDFYTVSIYSEFQNIGAGDILAEVSTLKSVEDQNVYGLIDGYNTKLKTLIEKGLIDSLQAIKEADNFINRYSPILRQKQEYVDSMFKSIQIIEELSETNFDNINLNDIRLGDFVLKFPVKNEFVYLFTSESEIETFSKWNDVILLYLSGFPSLFDRFILYIGSMLKKFSLGIFSEETSLSYKNYGLLRLIKSDSIQPIYFLSEFLNKLSLEKKINTLYDINIVENVNDDMLPSPLKSVLPGLETIDFIDFNEYLLDEDDFDEADFEKHINFLILSEIARKKKNLSDAIDTIIRLFQDKKFNFKTLYVENQLRNILTKIQTVIRDSSNDPALYSEQNQKITLNNTVLSNKTLSSLELFLVDSENKIDLNEKIIEDYRILWKYYYANTEELSVKALTEELRSKL